MNRKLLVVLFSLFLVFFVSSASAENVTTGSADTSVKAPTAIDAATKLKLQLQLIQDQKKAAVAKVKEDVKTLIQAKRDEFKTKVLTIRDQKKKALVERIDVKLAKTNEKHSAKYVETLSRIQSFLDKIKQSTTSAAVIADVTAAQTAIDAAKTAVETQAAKAYTMAIADDSTLKLNAGTTVSQLRLDLTAIYKLIIDAKQAVQKLHADKPKLEKEATRSAEL